MIWKLHFTVFLASILCFAGGSTTDTVIVSSSPVFSGGIHHYAIDQSGQLLVWGIDDNDLFDRPSKVDVQAPLIQCDHIIGGTASQFSAYALDEEGKLWVLGTYIFAYGDQLPKDKPILTDVVMASAGFRHCLALQSDGSLWAWGMNNQGQADYKSFEPEYYQGQAVMPQKVMDNVRYINACSDGSYAITADNTLWGWGDLIPQNNDGSHFYPIPTKLAENVLFISNGMIIDTDSTLWQWSDLGQGEGHKKVVEVAKQVKFATCSGDSVFAMIKEDGSLWTWGSYNACGILGNGTTASSSAPQKIMDEVSYVEFASEHLLILKEDGTLWMTGYSYEDSETLSSGDRLSSLYPYPTMEGPSSYKPINIGS